MSLSGRHSSGPLLQAAAAGGAPVPPGATGRSFWGGWADALWRRPELLFFAGILVLVNWPLWRGGSVDPWVFVPAQVQAGQWWRVITHPFAHVSWYHLLLDGVAFLVLYHSLVEPSLWRRLTYVVGAGAGSLLLSMWMAPEIWRVGLCGLSGVAHGLMAVSALEMASGHDSRGPEARLGTVMFLLVVGKAVLEVVTGRMFFHWLHFGMMGDPVVMTHAGGILGALASYLAGR